MSETVDTVWPIALSDLHTVAELVTTRRVRSEPRASRVTTLAGSSTRQLAGSDSRARENGQVAR